MGVFDRKTWFQKHWPWAMPVGCLMPLVLIAASLFLLAHMSRITLRSSMPYQMAVKELSIHPLVLERLGDPVLPGAKVKGSIEKWDGGRGRATLRIPLEGPNGKGLALVKMNRDQADWSYESLIVRMEDEEEILIFPIPESQTASKTE